MNKRKTMNTTTWCKNKSVSAHDFIAEKLTTPNGKEYWCISFETDRQNRGRQILNVGLKPSTWIYRWVYTLLNGIVFFINLIISIFSYQVKLMIKPILGIQIVKRFLRSVNNPQP